MIPTMLGVVLLVFFLFNWVGGDPAYVLAGKISNPEQIDNIRRQLGVDQPYWVQLWIFVKQIAHRRLRRVSWSTNETVSHILATRLGPSLTVLVPLLVLETLLAIGLALAVAYVRGSLTDRAVMIVCTVGAVDLDPGLHHRRSSTCSPTSSAGSRCRAGATASGENLFTYAPLPILIGARRQHRAEPAAVPHLLPRRDQPGLRAHRARQGPVREPRSCGCTCCATR